MRLCGPLGCASGDLGSNPGSANISVALGRALPYLVPVSPRGRGRVWIGADLSLPMGTPPEGGLMPGPSLFPGFKPFGPGLASSLFYSGLSMAIPHPRGLASVLMARCPHPAPLCAPLGGSSCPLAQCCGQPGLPLSPVVPGLRSSPLTNGSPAIPALQRDSSSLGKSLGETGHIWGPWELRALASSASAIQTWVEGLP